MATFEEFMKVAEISIKDKTSHKRMNEIVRIMRQYKVLHGLTPEQAVEVLQALGPTYVKIGQLASNRSDLLPKAYCDAFEKLRDDANPMPFDVVIEQIDRAYGKSWHEVFASIDPVPLGAASIAQVHKATLLVASAPQEAALPVLRCATPQCRSFPPHRPNGACFRLFFPLRRSSPPPVAKSSALPADACASRRRWFRARIGNALPRAFF